MRRFALLIATLLVVAPWALAEKRIPNISQGDLPSLLYPENLETACADGKIMKAAGGEWSCGDDDVGAGSDTTCLDAGVDCLFAAAATEGGAATSATETAVTAHEAALTITESQISDLAHTVDTTCADGPCSLASGTTLNGATIQTGTDDDIPEADDFTNLTAGRSLTAPTTGTLDADVELYERTVAINIDPSHSTTDWIVFRAPRNIVVTGIDCIVASATSVVATVRECDANGANCAATEAAITCGVTNSTESGAIDDPNIDAGDYVRILRGTVTGTPGQLSVTVTYEAAD